MSLSKKLPLAIALALVLTLAAGFAGLWTAHGALRVFNEDVLTQVADERSVASLENHFKTQVQEWKNVLLRGGDPALRQRHWDAFQAEETVVRETAEALATRLQDGDTKALATQFIAQHREMASRYRAGFETFQAQGFAPAAGDAAVRGVDREPVRLLAQLSQAISAQSAATAARAFDSGSRATTLSLVLMLVATALGIAIGVLVTRAVLRPLRSAVAVASEVAQGNLAHPITSAGRDELGQLLQALGVMQRQLRELVGDVRGNAEQVASTSSEIAMGNSDLAERTERQASALQVTASSIQALDGTVRGNADSAQQAERLARDASGVATAGSHAIAAVVDTMQGIQASSRRVGDIIELIDGLAFQTNVLAINAAVEAARAGPQGRGFAVVANEVGQLSRRSATAAREIRALILASTEQVEQGTQQVQAAGQTIRQVEAAILEVNRLVQAISHASVAQSAGVSQVNAAITRIEEGTQQNAALVEETSAAAESLRVQAHRLVTSVSRFRVA